MRRLLVIGLLVVAGALGIWTAAWYVGTQRLIAGLEQWAAARRAEGWQVAYDTPIAAGFPTKIAALIPNPAITAPARAAGGLAWEWRAPTLRAEFVPWRPDRIALRNRGANQLALIRGGVRYQATLDCDDALVRLEAARHEGGQYVVELGGPVFELVEPPVTAQATQLTLTLQLHHAPPNDHLASTADLGFAIDNLITESFGKMGGTPLSINVQASLMGGLPSGPLDQALAGWRDDGGTIEVPRLTFHAATINVSANGTLALDNELRPMGAASAAIRGYDEALDRLTAAGTVNPRDAQLAKLLLSAIAHPANDGERVLNVPITGQNGWLYVGPVRLTRLEPLKLR
jgi:hypothetical protein